MIPTIPDSPINKLDSTEHEKHQSEGFRATQTADSSQNHHHSSVFSADNTASTRNKESKPSHSGKVASPHNGENATTRGKSQSSITANVIDGLTHGQTPRMIASRLSLPLDLVDLIIERERAAGRLDVYDLRSCNSTTGEGCDPDPESLVCASCPILPAAIRKRQSVFARLKARLHK
ncbi:hypothetical protein [Bifidobacterium sp. ESL0790]|uniref:hypothetical protein n=1 Tax=Bifidobacterium sp. ESL0790 TaxID=2983233 RepID=UPI0023F95652|nr:hypothetical protein [Bifidobacterium sp. ESL0790]WEV72439.1 hypothetical protein OZY47_00090 [Bifidobacterium sp. ESL0790]